MFDLHTNFGLTAGTVCFGFQAVRFFRSGLSADDDVAGAITEDERNERLAALDSRYAGTGFASDGVPMQLAIIVPFVLRRTWNRELSPFFNLVEIFLPCHAKY
jgi:hypothetical protein